MAGGGKTLKRTVVAAVAIVLAHFAIACGASDSAPEDHAADKAAIGHYRAYLEEKSALLVRALQALFAEVKQGDRPRAGSRYARARVRYGEVQPFAMTFSKLNSSINGYATEVAPSEFRGFHKLERTIFGAETTKGMTPIARRLLADAKELEARFKSVPMPPGRIARGASETAGALFSFALIGNYEPYARIDMVDVAANIEGIEAAFQAVKPLLTTKAKLVKKVEAELTKLFATVGEFGTLARQADQPRARSPGVSFVVFNDLSLAEVGKVGHEMEKLIPLLSEVQEQVAGS